MPATPDSPAASVLEELRTQISVATGHRNPSGLVRAGRRRKDANRPEYAHRFKADYDFVWWIPSSSPTHQHRARRTGNRLGHPVRESVEDAAEAARDALRGAIPTPGGC